MSLQSCRNSQKSSGFANCCSHSNLPARPCQWILRPTNHQNHASAQDLLGTIIWYFLFETHPWLKSRTGQNLSGLFPLRDSTKYMYKHSTPLPSGQIVREAHCPKPLDCNFVDNMEAGVILLSRIYPSRKPEKHVRNLLRRIFLTGHLISMMQLKFSRTRKRMLRRRSKQKLV